MVLTCIYEKIGIINWKLANYVKIWQGFDENPHYEVCVSAACDKGVFAVFSRVWTCELNYGRAVLHCDIFSLQCKKSAWASGLWGVGVLLGETFDRCGAEARCMLGFGWVQRVLQMNKRPVKVYRPLIQGQCCMWTMGWLPAHSNRYQYAFGTAKWLMADKSKLAVKTLLRMLVRPNDAKRAVCLCKYAKARASSVNR